MYKQVMTEPGTIEFLEVPVPVPGANEVLVKIRYIGICGSDMHVYHGKHPFTAYPVTQGHEVSGEIVELGNDVKDLTIGQKVTIEPQVVCGNCHPCRNGKYNLCETLKVMGFQTTGTASEFFAVDALRITPIPDDMDIKVGALIEPLAVAVHAVKQAGTVEGKNIIVIGAGPIGNLVAQTAKGMGAKTVLITDVHPYRLDLAARTGIDYQINTKQDDLGEKISEYFGADKADIIIDCAGNNTTINQAIAHARKGSTIILVAVFDGMATVDLALLQDHELSLLSSAMYRHEDYLDAIRLAQSSLVELPSLITKVFPFKEFSEAYAYIEGHGEESMKVLIDMQA